MKSDASETNYPSSLARRLVALLCLIPLWNCAAAAAMGYFVVYSDADDYKFLVACFRRRMLADGCTGFMKACSICGILCKDG